MRVRTSGHVGAVVVGAGQAGLAVSRELLVRGIDHVVLERGCVGETWRSQRSDSFVLNTPVWMNRLPGSSMVDSDPTRFPTGREFVEDLERYVRSQGLPVREGVDVEAVELAGGTYVVKTSSGLYRSGSVVVAAGIQRTPRIPALAGGLSASTEQLEDVPFVVELRDGRSRCEGQAVTRIAASSVVGAVVRARSRSITTASLQPGNRYDGSAHRGAASWSSASRARARSAMTRLPLRS